MKLSPALQEAQKRYGIIEFKGVIGSDERGNCDVPGWPGYVYVQLRQADGLSAPIPARWQAVCAKNVGQPIDIGYDHSGNLCVLRADFDGQVANGINPLSNNPADKNVSTFINQSQITTLLSHVVSSASDSMLVTVEEYIYIKSGTIHWFLGGNGDGSTPIDLTSFIPVDAATQCMAALFLKDDDTIEVQVSSNIPASDPLWINEAQECLDASTTGSSFIWAYHLYYGQTTIVDGTKAVGGDTVLDFRQIVSLWGAGGTGMASFDVAADSGTPATIGDGDTITFEGAGGIATSIVGDTVTIDGSGISGFAPANAHYVTTQAESGLSNEFNLGGLSSGLLKQSVSTGVSTPAIATAGTDYTTPTGTESLSNKTITTSSLVATALSLLIGGFKAIFTHANTADRTYTFQDSSYTVVGRDTTDTLTNKSIVATQLTGTLQAGQMPALTGDVTTPGGSLATTLATVNSNVGTFAGGLSVTANAKGLITAIATSLINLASQVTGLLPLANGGTHADLSATGGANQFLKQSTSGGNVSVGTIADADLPTALASHTISGGTIDNTPVGTTTRALGYFSALREYIGGFAAIFTHANSADRTYTLPNASGTVALTSDIGTPVTSVGATSPLASSGGTTPTISISGQIGIGNLADGFRKAVFAVAISNVTVSSPGSTFDGVTPSTGDRILLTGQSSGSENGIWTFNGSSSALTRPTDYASGNTVQAFQRVIVYSVFGAAFNGSFWQCTTSGTITIDTTSTAWQQNHGSFLGSIVLRNNAQTFSTALSANSATADRSISFPDATGAVVLDNATQSISAKTITGGSINNTNIGLTTRAAGYFSELREYIGGFAAIFTHADTADRTYTLPDKTGTVALTSDIAVTVYSANNILTGNAASFDFTSIPGTYQHLVLKLKLRSDKSATNENVYIRFNNDSTAADYYSEGVAAAGTTPTLTATQRLGATGTGIEIFGGAAAATATAHYFAVLEVHILNYANANTPKQIWWNGYLQVANTTGNLFAISGGGLWVTTGAITRITVLPTSAGNFVADSSCEVLAVA